MSSNDTQGANQASSQADSASARAEALFQQRRAVHPRGPLQDLSSLHPEATPDETPHTRPRVSRRRKREEVDVTDIFEFYRRKRMATLRAMR